MKMGIKEIQKKAAGIADELLRLEKDSGSMLAAPDSAADFAVLKLQCRICLGQIEALETKIRSLQESVEKADAEELSPDSTESIAATRVLLQQYLAILGMKKEETAAYLETIEENMK